MPRRDRTNNHPLGKAKNCPCGEENEVRHSGDMPGDCDGRIKRLQTAENGECLTYAESTTVKRVMEMIPAGLEGRFARHGSANKTGQAVINWNGRKPKSHNR